MRFGLLLPQGRRHDLVGIDPAFRWRTLHDLARRADDGVLSFPEAASDRSGIELSERDVLPALA
ncbi:hypothetical protein [Rathayibacter sp. AY1B5]|uniref:hypothetical protein n=1 Tax=Rathayibacter sp. AY1B5 TaxID=2080530 RepID=UPI000CE77E79|nr:hypothetical protein [Rathayibacter sp. AY1B5]PPI20857.1 hypothetical protein C5D44_16045 [Rathayibacter sp. AY1B5]